jgi:hypothetical protein
MTPIVDELREVGLRWNPSMLPGRYRGQIVPRKKIIKTERGYRLVQALGRRTLGEYWRRRKMVGALMLRWTDDWGVGDRALAIQYCRARGWKAWPKPGWRR